MDIALWIIAAALAAVFLASGAVKLAQPAEKLAATGLSVSLGKTIGVLEVLAAAGLILPAALDIAPVLSPLAATGLVLLMAGAVVQHVRRRETKVAAVPVVLLVLAAVVAWGWFA
ncbi:DoxX family protein [Amycolatopsis tucumanensis]|nr:DoxX family protein [Amycolatopsis tucumanensis]MCF6425969.1 DoxX family protein [Amycolatopsis tucumanensis]